MSGTANFEEKHLFVIDGPCIIVVDDVNRPTGIWWGTVRSIEEKGFESCKYLQLVAEITGGKFCIDGKPIFSDENRGCIPTVNYTVYPDIPSVRQLFQRNSSYIKEYHQISHELRKFKQYHADTMSALGRK